MMLGENFIPDASLIEISRALAELVLSQAPEEKGELFLGTVTATGTGPNTVTVAPDSSYSDTPIGPINLFGVITTPAVGSRVLCFKTVDGAVLCLGAIVT